MNDVAEQIEKARSLLAAGEERKAADVLGWAVTATDDPEILERIHALAVEGHEHAAGFRKIHWHELMLDVEARLPRPVA